MECLRCGTQIEGNAEFCEACLRSMENYPVKPGTVIQLHRREVVSAQKKAPRPKRQSDLEAQILFLKKSMGIMMLLLVIAMVALGAAVGMLLML